MTVRVTAPRTTLDCSGARESTARRPKTTEARPAWPEPADEGHRGPVEPAAGEREGDRDHPHDGEGEQREHDIAPAHVGQSRAEHGGTEHEPDEEGEERAGFLGEAEVRLVVAAVEGAEGHAGDEGGDEAVGAGDHGGGVGEEGQGEDGDGPEAGGAPAVAAGQDQEAGADAPTPRPRAAPPRRSSGRGARADAGHAFSAHRARDEEIDERGGDAVIEAALHVEETAHARGHPLVAHDGGAQGGVGRGDDGADGGGQPEAARAEEERGNPGPGADGEGEADAEQARRECGIGPQGPDVDPGGIGEEHEGEGDFRQRADRRGMQVDVDQRRRPMGDGQAEEDEGDRGGDVPALQAGRDETPDEDAGGDDGKRDVECWASWFMGRILPVWAAYGSGLGGPVMSSGAVRRDGEAGSHNGRPTGAGLGISQHSFSCRC